VHEPWKSLRCQRHSSWFVGANHGFWDVYAIGPRLPFSLRARVAVETVIPTFVGSQDHGSGIRLHQNSARSDLEVFVISGAY